MEPLSGVHQVWSLVETSNADQNGHETLVKVGRNVPWTSAGLVLTGLTVGYLLVLLALSLLTSTIHKPRSIRSQITARLEAGHANGSAVSRCKQVPTLKRQARWHPFVVPRKTESLVGTRIDFGDKGDTDCRIPHGLGVCVIMGGR